MTQDTYYNQYDNKKQKHGDLQLAGRVSYLGKGALVHYICKKTRPQILTWAFLCSRTYQPASVVAQFLIIKVRIFQQSVCPF